MAAANECPIQPSKEVDIYRDTPVRLLGYANEVGEAFRALVNVKLVYASYGVASAYVLADTYDKASKVKKAPLIAWLRSRDTCSFLPFLVLRTLPFLND